MKKLVTTLLFVFTLLQCFTIFNDVFSQEGFCVLEYPASGNNAFKPPKTELDNQFLRILIVYVTFFDDNYPPLYDNFWQPYQKPVSPNGTTGLINPSEVSSSVPFMDRYPEYTISDYFCEMSLGKLDVVGEEVLVNLPLSSTHYRL